MPVKKAPRRKAAAKKSKPARRAPARRRGRSSNVGEYASLSVKRSMDSGGGNQFALNTLYSLMNTQLDQFPRAVQVAQAYQHYRIKKVALTFKPSYDTFQEGALGTKQRLYYMIDKAGAIPTNVSLEGLKQMGARPKDFDEKNIVIQWAPSVLESTMFQAPNSVPSKYNISPWLSTTAVPLTPGAFVPSSVDHLGLYWYVDAINPGAAQYAIECEVQFEFKKPLTTIRSSVEAKPAQYAVINDSPDGIVGGTDDHLATSS